MRVPRGLNGWWRAAVVPLIVWLLVMTAGTGVLLWQQSASRAAVAGRFEAGVDALGQYMQTTVAGVLAREMAEAQSSLADPVVTARDFDVVVTSFGYTSAVLLDSTGRAIQSYPRTPSVVGQDVGVRYEHLRTALQGSPAVSEVVPNASRGTLVVAFAVPFETGSGRRVFSGALPIQASPLASYFTTALSLTGARVQLVDTSGDIVAATDPFTTAKPTLAGQDAPLAAALTGGTDGRYQAGGEWWRYSSDPVPGTPWRLSATVRENVLFASLCDTEIGGRIALGGAALLGLVVVAVVGRARAGRRDLLLSEQRFRKVFDGSRIGMLLADMDGRCLRVNPAACEIFGRTEPEMVGRLLDDFTLPEDRTLAAGPMRDCLEGRSDGFELDKRYVRADGQVVEAAIASAVLTDEHDRPQLFATQIVDTTEQRTLQRERERHAEQLQEANTHLADVMAMLSHDVRQPLAKIIGLGGLLQEAWDAMPEKTKIDYVRRMTAAGDRANDLVTDILMLAQFDAGAILARPIRVDISHAVREAVNAHQLSNASPVPLTVIAPDETTGLADPGQLQLILGNLLTNAGKYGRPPIEVIVVNAEHQIAIRVADRGEGVPEEFVPKLFDRFARAASGVATTTPGTGLGLYLVRQLALAGGLDVTYEPNRPQGAVFTLTVPRAPGTLRAAGMVPDEVRDELTADRRG